MGNNQNLGTLIFAVIVQFFTFTGLTFNQKWLRVSSLLVGIPVLLDLLPGELPLSISMCCMFSILLGIAGFVSLIFIEFHKDVNKL